MEQVRRHSVGAGAAAFPWSRVPWVLLAGFLRAHCRDSGWAMCERNMLRNQKLSGQSRTFFFHMSRQLVIAYDLRLQCVGGQMISKHFLIREKEPSPASVPQPGRVVKCWEGVG